MSILFTLSVTQYLGNNVECWVWLTGDFKMQIMPDCDVEFIEFRIRIASECEINEEESENKFPPIIHQRRNYYGQGGATEKSHLLI